MSQKIDERARCLACSQQITDATSAHGDEQPSHGDVTVCLYCAHVMVFVALRDRLVVRNPTVVEAAKFAADPYVQRTVAAVKAALQS